MIKNTSLLVRGRIKLYTYGESIILKKMSHQDQSTAFLHLNLASTRSAWYRIHNLWLLVDQVVFKSLIWIGLYHMRERMYQVEPEKAEEEIKMKGKMKSQRLYSMIRKMRLHVVLIWWLLSQMDNICSVQQLKEAISLCMIFVLGVM